MSISFPWYRFARWLRRHWVVAWLAGLVGYGLMGLVLLDTVVRLGWLGPLPAVPELRHLRQALASEIYTIDGALLGKFYLENRTEIGRHDLPSHFVDALIATEDVRFWSHAGIDYRSLLRVIVRSLLLADPSGGGGSTLTQQLAKNLYPRRQYRAFSLLINKLREIAIAERLEACYSKDEILLRYLNTVSFGDNAFGVEVASQRYFSRPAAQLRLEEAATLVGMLKAPTAYNPRRHPEAALSRRNVVLDQLARYGYAPAALIDSVQALPLTLAYSYQNHHTGLAPYFRQQLRRDLLRWCRTHPRRDGTYYNPFTDGLRIYTTLHAGLQAYAEAAVAENMTRVQANFDREWRGRDRQQATQGLVDQALRRSPRYRALMQAGYSVAAIDSLLALPHPMRIFTWEGPRDTLLSPRDSVLHSAFTLHTGFMAMEPGSGHVRAWVGGIEHQFFQYDHVLSRRQTGSTFKPLVYAAALEEQLSPCTFIPNERVVFEAYDNWTPGNANGAYGGEYTFEEALSQSINVVAVNLIMEIGAERVAALARQMGMGGDLPAVPSLALGTGEASLFELLQAYAAFANGGRRVQPVYLLRIEDGQGQILADFTYDVPDQQVIHPSTAAILTHLLQAVVNEGTARSLRSRYGLRLDIAGKTGTTQNQTDGWFVGNTPELIAGAWVGAEDQRVHFRSLRAGQGAATALPIWASFMQRVARDPDFAYVAQAKFPPLTAALTDSLACDYDVPLAESEFKVWYEQYLREQDSLARLQGGTP